MTSSPLPNPPAERLATLLEFLRRVLAAQAAKDRLLQSILPLVWRRLGRIAARVLRLAARIAPGAPPRPHTTRPARAATALPAGAPAPRPAIPRPWARLPRRSGWLWRLTPAAIPAASQLRHLLADPEMAALLAASPGIRRSLRPLCRMLALPSPAPARPSPSPRPRGAPPAGAPPPRRTAPPPAFPPFRPLRA